MRNFFVILIAVFCYTATYAEGEECGGKTETTTSEDGNTTCIREVKGGKTIKVGDDAGEKGYKNVEESSCDYTIGTGSTHTIKCSGRGDITCPPSPCKSILTPEVYNNIIARVYMEIDMGLTAGEFLIAGVACTWSDGEIEEDEEEEGTFNYSYKLIMVYKNPVIVVAPIIPMTITVVPNSVQDHITVHFSKQIDGMVEVKIVDMTGDIQWDLDMHVSGNVLPIDGLDLLPGTYHIICTMDGEAAIASFVVVSPVIPMTITVFPNPVQNNLSVRFSRPINDVKSPNQIVLFDLKQIVLFSRRTRAYPSLSLASLT